MTRFLVFLYCVYIVICLEINVKGVRHCYESGTRDGDRHAVVDRVGFVIGGRVYHSGVSDCVWVWVGLRLS
jgi:hypothetical protein